MVSKELMARGWGTTFASFRAPEQRADWERKHRGNRRRLIGIGAAVTRRPLPHHRTCGSASGGLSWLSDGLMSSPLFPQDFAYTSAPWATMMRKNRAPWSIFRGNGFWQLWSRNRRSGCRLIHRSAPQIWAIIDLTRPF